MVDSKKLAHLLTTNDELNTESDGLNEIVENLEQTIRGKVGVTACYDQALLCPEGPFEQRDERTDESICKYLDGYYLGWAKCPEWHICVQEVQERLDANGEFDGVLSKGKTFPLTSASRAMRAEAAKHLDALLDVLIARSEEYLKNVRNAKELAQ